MRAVKREHALLVNRLYSAAYDPRENKGYIGMVLHRSHSAVSAGRSGDNVLYTHAL